MIKPFSITAIAATAALVSACVPPPPVYESDITLRAERFDSCLKNLPAGPQSTRYNDWAEVVEACDIAARDQARRCVKNCPGAAND